MTEPIGEIGNERRYARSPYASKKEDPPLLFEPVKLYRHWKLQNGRIVTPIHGHMEWQNGENKAWCDHKRCLAKDCPYFDQHSCGFYGVWGDEHQYAEKTSIYSGVIFGVVEFYGRVMLGTYGARGSHARIAALHLPAQDQGVWGVVKRSKNGLFENYPNVRFYRSRDNLVRAEGVEFPKDLVQGISLGGTFG